MSSQRFSVRVVIVLLIWCMSAVLLGVLGVLGSLRPPFPQVILFGLVALLLIAYGSSTEFRRWISSIPLEWLISVHLVRFVGFYFLWLYEQRQLPFAFAVPGGWGDILVATLALILLVLRPRFSHDLSSVERAWVRGHPLRGRHGDEIGPRRLRVHGGSSSLSVKPPPDVHRAAHHFHACRDLSAIEGPPPRSRGMISACPECASYITLESLATLPTNQARVELIA